MCTYNVCGGMAATIYGTAYRWASYMAASAVPIHWIVTLAQRAANAPTLRYCVSRRQCSSVLCMHRHGVQWSKTVQRHFSNSANPCDLELWPSAGTLGLSYTDDGVYLKILQAFFLDLTLQMGQTTYDSSNKEGHIKMCYEKNGGTHSIMALIPWS